MSKGTTLGWENISVRKALASKAGPESILTTLIHVPGMVIPDHGSSAGQVWISGSILFIGRLA